MFSVTFLLLTTPQFSPENQLGKGSLTIFAKRIAKFHNPIPSSNLSDGDGCGYGVFPYRQFRFASAGSQQIPFPVDNFGAHHNRIRGVF
jgi:hypothetical protein